MVHSGLSERFLKMKLAGRCMFIIRDMEIARPNRAHRTAKSKEQRATSIEHWATSIEQRKEPRQKNQDKRKKTKDKRQKTKDKRQMIPNPFKWSTQHSDLSKLFKLQTSNFKLFKPQTFQTLQPSNLSYSIKKHL